MFTDFRRRKPSVSDLMMLRGLWRQHPRYSGCVGHWLMNEGGGTIAYDSSGYGRHGTITGATYFAGPSGYALSFDGTDAITVPGGYASPEISFLIWYNFRETVNLDTGWLVNQYRSTADAWGVRLRLHTGPLVRLGIYDDIDNTDLFNYLIEVAGGWHLATAIIRAGDQELYFDGNLIGSGIPAGGPFANIGVSNLYIGNRSGAAIDDFIGDISEVRVYDRALPAAEVKSFVDARSLEYSWAAEQIERSYFFIHIPGGAGAEGTLSQTLATLVGTATGDLAIEGTSTRTLGTLTGAATGELEIAGSATRTLGALTLDSAAEVALEGAATPTLGALTSDAAGQLAIEGTSAPTLAALTVDAAGTGAEVTVGSANVTLGALTSAAMGELPIEGSTAETLGALTSTSTATLALIGNVAATLDAATLAAVGAAGERTATLTVTLAPLTLFARETVGGAASAPQTLDSLLDVIHINTVLR